MSPDFLAQLAPDHAPAAPGWWPLAPGWWVLMLLALVLLVLFLRSRRDPTRTPRRAALRELAAIERAQLGDGPTARAVENVLRRYALTVFGHARVARLSGEAWLAFLGERGAPGLEGELGRTLLASAFSARPEPARERWLTAAAAFVRHTRRRARREVRA